VARRKKAALERTRDLEEALGRFIPRQHPSKFMARVYQALRIEVNAEMEALQEMLPQCTEALATGGRLVVITYHSIEDRLVKNFMRSGNLEGTIEKDFYGNALSPWKLVNRSVIVPTKEEVEANNRARSAKLRIAERVNNG
jgi:16S rRNA (cytosine1402-N4)-methyltransferase